MKIARYKTFIVVLLMLVFTGPVLASVKLSCHSQTSDQNTSSDMMDHSQHLGMDTSPADAAADFECCVDCDCNLNGCTATAALSAPQSLSVTGYAPLASHYNELAVTQPTVSLFRPPIFR